MVCLYNILSTSYILVKLVKRLFLFSLPDFILANTDFRLFLKVIDFILQ